MSREHNGTSNRRLRRLSGRAKYIVEKHRSENPVIAATADPMLAAFTTFNDAYDRYTASAAGKEAEVAHGRSKVDALQVGVRQWLALVQRDVGVDTSRFRLHTDVPDDVIGAARLLLRVVEDAAEGGTELVYGQQAIEALQKGITEAETAWHAARTAITKRQDDAAVVRAAAAAAQTELVALRRLLQASVGRSDLDYQALRVSKGGSDEEPEQEEQSAATDEESGNGTSITEADRKSGEFTPTAVAS